uniref:C-type lectin domain-containing protein n=1 Tax=Caenorhabditis japonica TaxID=281687 RepID=H2WGU9_CAEJA
MRSSQQLLLALGLFLALVHVDAFIRPAKTHKKPHNDYSKGGEDCVETTKKPHVATTEKPVTTTQKQLTCPEGFVAFARQPSAENAYTSLWCLKAALQRHPIMISEANQVCSNHGGVLSAPESPAERDYITSQLLYAVKTWGFPAGAIAVDGRRKQECVTRNQTVLESLPCSNKAASFSLQDSHTDSQFMWSQWALDEPSANAWTYDIEECVQLAVIPENPKRDNLLNDFYCNFRQAPNDPDYTLYMNFGAVCGTLPQ